MAATTPRKKKNVKDLIRGAKLPVEKVKICTRPDLIDEYEELATRVAVARGNPTSISGAPELPTWDARLEELKGEIEDTTIEFKIRGLPQPQYTALAAKYPAREGNQKDLLAGGVNVDEMAEQLIKLGTIDPVLDEEDWLALLTGVSNVGYTKLTLAAWAANNRDVSAPF